MDNDIFKKALQAMSIKEQRKMTDVLLRAIEAKNLQYQGEKGDSVVDVYQRNGELYVVIEQLGGKQKTINVGKVKGERGDDGDDYELTQKDIEDIAYLVAEMVEDGSDGEDGKDGYTPIKGVDYFTKDELVEVEINTALSVESQLAPIIMEETKPETLADKLESLEGDARLSYTALKDTPRIPDLRSLQFRDTNRLRDLVDFDPTGTSGQVLYIKADGTFGLKTVSGGGGSGDVTGPASSTDNAVARFDGATGKILQNSGVTISDTNIISGAGLNLSGLTASRVVQTDGSKNLESSAVTTTELGYVSGVTSAIQTQLDGKAASSHTHNATEVTLSNIAGATYTNVQQMQDIFHSSGVGTGGTITDNGDGTYAVAAGTGWIRATNDATDTLLAFDWSANASLTPSDGRNYVGVEYNAGSPQIVQRAAYDWNYQTDFPLGEVVKEGSVLHIFNAQHKVGDHAGKMIEAMEDTMAFARDNRTGGLILGETGTRNITMSAGYVWYGLIENAITAKDTSVADTIDFYYRDGVGGWTLTTGNTQWDNTQYDNNTGTLATMTAAKYGVHWFYLDVEGSGSLVMVYSQVEYNTVADANDATPPTNLPDRLQSHGRIIGRLIFQKSAASATSVESVFNTIFSSSAVVNHNNLAGLQGGTTGEYYHLTSAQVSALHDAVTVADSAEIDFTLTGQQISASLVAGSIDETKLDTSVNASLDLADSSLQPGDIGSTVQAYDADLAGIAALTINANDLIVGNGSNSFTTTTVTTFAKSLLDDANAATARTTLGVGTSDSPQFTAVNIGHATDTTLSRSSAGVLAVEGVVIPSISSTNTLTNKRITPRVSSETSSATPTINTDNVDAHSITALAVDITSFTTNLSGTPTDFQKLTIRIKDNGTARAIAWGASFEDAGQPLPTTTVISKLLTVGFIYNSVTSKWGCVAVANET